MMKKKYVYCSGALFSPEELAAMSEIADVLEASGYGTYLPQRDGVEAFVMNAVDSLVANLPVFLPFSRLVNSAVFSLDIYQIIEICDYFVFNMNGRVPDEGGVVETAVAFAMGKPIIIYKNDQRAPFKGFDSPLLLGASYTYSVVDEIRNIPSALEILIQKLESLGDAHNPVANLPPRVKQANDFGRKVWKFLQIVQFLKPTNRLLKNTGY